MRSREDVPEGVCFVKQKIVGFNVVVRLAQELVSHLRAVDAEYDTDLGFVWSFFQRTTVA